jgi:hypothetical protein
MPQRSRSYRDPLDLGVYDRTSIRHIKGRIGVENKGQAGFRLSNDGSSNAYQNVWFRVTLKDSGYLIFLKENNRDRRHYIINVYTDDHERKQLAYPVSSGAGTNLFNNMVAGVTSDLYNIIDDKSEFADKNSTSLYPLPKGSYLVNITTQRWDIFRYGVYMLIEMPKQTGYVSLETDGNQPREFLLQEGSSLIEPMFLLLEGTVLGVLDNIRERTSRDQREYRDAWSDLSKNKPFPDEILNYLRSTQTLG